MAKAKAGRQQRQEPQVEESGGEGLDLTEIQTGSELDAALEKVYSEIGSDGERSANVYVYKVIPDEAKEARVWNGSPSDYDLDAIAKRFGSGDYRVKVYIAGDTGRMGLAPGGNKVLTILLDPAEDERIRRQREGSPAQAPAAAGITRDDLVAAIRAAMPAQPVAPAFNPMDMMTGLAGIVSKMVPQREDRPAFDPIGMLRMVAEVVRDSRKNASDGDEDDAPRRGSSNTNDIWITLINKFGPMFAEAMAQRGAVMPAGMGGTVMPVAAPGGAAMHAPVSSSNESGKEVSAEDAAMGLKQGLQFLTIHAERDSDPTTYAGLILDMVPEAELKTLLNAPDWFERLVSFSAPVARHRKWFGELRDVLLEDLNGPENEAPLTEGAETGKKD